MSLYDSLIVFSIDNPKLHIFYVAYSERAVHATIASAII